MCSIISTNRNDKLDEVLRILTLRDYTSASTTCLDILLSHIASNIPSECLANGERIDKSSLQKWVLRALETWTAEQKPCQAVVTFTIKLVGLLGSNESDFLYWYREDVFAKLKTVFGLGESGLQPSVKMAYASMLLEFLNHKSGRRWIVESGSWRDVIRFCHTNHTLYVTRESQKFVWKLLLLKAGDVKFCEEVIAFAAEPLIKNTFSPQPCPTLKDNDSDRNELLLAVIDLLTAVLENTLFVSMDNTIPRLLESVTNLECRIKGLFEACRPEFLDLIMKLMYLLLLAGLKDNIEASTGKVDPEIMNNFRCKLRYIDSTLLANKCILGLIKGRKIFVIYWEKMNVLCKVEIPYEYKLETQCLLIVLMPLSCCMPIQQKEEDLMEMFLQKIVDLTCTYTQRLYYMMRDILRKENPPMEKICEISIETVMDILDIVERDGAVIIFQAMFYLLRDFVSFANNKSVKIDEHRNSQGQNALEFDPIERFPNLLSVLLEGLTTIIHKFNFKWLECFETIRISYFAQNLLNHPNVKPELCVQALSLCKLAIQNFMAPNLALLLQPDSGANEIGPVLYKRMHDPNWEVRDSVLEVINTIATISEDKYPAFQDLLLENGFPQLIAHVAVSDGESKVRASALSCTASFVRINKIWNKELCQLDLPKMGIDLMTNESEGIVRKEAVRLVKELYVHRKWPKSVIEEMTKAMAAAAVSDLHWEVRVYALEFWAQFIKSQLSDQGMLDGCFPTVTFSKEHRKIVCLNNEEIRKRILKALDELAKQNCLGVLLATLEDDSDVQVRKASGETIKEFKNVFMQYKVNESPPVQSTNLLNVSSSPLEESENVLSNRTEITVEDTDGIIQLASIYKRTLKISSKSESNDGEVLKAIPHIDKDQFVRFVLQCDVDARIETKNSPMKTYGSVLDDILSVLRDGLIPT